MAQTQGFSWRETAPWRLLFVTVLAHGVLLPWLGFYWDDWTPLLAAHMPGITWRDFVDAFWQNRPASGLLFWALTGVLGARPWLWHSLILLLRWGVAWAAAALSVRVWPRTPALAWWTGVFVAVYPGFRLQPVAVAFTPHMLSFLLFLGSLLALWEGWHAARPWRRWAWWTFSWASLLLSWLLLEYYIGLEVARLGLLGLLAYRAAAASDQRTAKRGLLEYSLPYVATVAIGLLLLTQWSRPPEVHDGLALLRRYPGLAAHTLFYTLFSGWFTAELFVPASWKTLRFVGLMGVGGLIGVLLAGWTWFARPALGRAAGQVRDVQGASVAAVVLLLAPLISFWLNGRFIASLYSDRFGLPALLGVGLLYAALVVRLRPVPGVQRGLVWLLLALAGQTLFFNAWGYRVAWKQVRQIYAQLYWRAPGIDPGTPLLGEGAQAKYISQYVVGESLNVLYAAAQTEPRTLAYWFYSAAALPRPSAQAEPVPLETQHKIWTFRGDARHSVLFLSRLARQGQRCVWVLTPEDRDNPYIPDEVRPYTAYADWTRIRASSAGPPPAFFGIPPQSEDWCFFYEKAELARQQGDWAAVAALWEEIQARHLRARHIYEYRPFVLALGHLGRWDEAAALSRRAWHERPIGGDDEAVVYLCQTWRTLQQQTPATQARAAAWSEIQALLGEACPASP